MKNITNYLHLLVKETPSFYLKENNEIISSLLVKLKEKYSIKEICNMLNLSQRTVYYYFDGRRTPSIKVLLRIIDLIDESNFLHTLYDNLIGVSTWGHSYDKLPKIYSSELAYLTGLICGDGHISRRTEIYIWSDSKFYLLNKISTIIEKLFNYKPKHRDLGTYHRIDIASRPINFFFDKIVGIPKGKKKGLLRIPQFIYLSDQFKINFLRGLFDSDGGITFSKNKKFSILYSASTYNFLLQIQKLLNDLNINLPGPYSSGSKRGFEIRSFSKKEIKKFNQVIGSDHPIKSKKLDALVAQFG